MFRKIIILILSFFIINCTGNDLENQRSVKLSSGKTAEVFFEKQLSPENQPVLVVDYKTEESNPKEKQVEQDVLEIWEAVKNVAEKLELEEGVIRYRIFTEEKNENGQPTKLYTGLLFTAEKIENGKWKIDKIY